MEPTIESVFRLPELEVNLDELLWRSLAAPATVSYVCFTSCKPPCAHFIEKCRVGGSGRCRITAGGFGDCSPTAALQVGDGSRSIQTGATSPHQNGSIAFTVGRVPLLHVRLLPRKAGYGRPREVTLSASCSPSSLPSSSRRSGQSNNS